MMGKKVGDAIYSPAFSMECLNCLCQVCTGRKCPYQHLIYFNYRFRCAKCARGDFTNKICGMCDFFENCLRVRQKFKIKRRWHRESTVEKKLDAIMQAVGVKLSNAEDLGHFGQNDGK